MAEPIVAASTANTPTENLAAFVTLPDNPTSVASAANPSKAANPANFLKPQPPRKRRRSSERSNLLSPVETSRTASPALISPKTAFSPSYTPRALTAAAAMVDEKRQRQEQEKILSRQTSPNPARNALGTLLGGQGGGISRPQDAPNPANTLSEPIAAIASSIKPVETAQGEESMQTSPLSVSSFGTLESTAGGPISANGVSVASPGRIDEGLDCEAESSRHSNNGNDGDNGMNPDEGRHGKAMTFPGPLLSAQVADARRGMSLPHSGFGRDSPKSPSTKKHKCPYCSTDFTRHHNLKSHLLTHSHEKPYMCETCDARFRRLHDLKRHTKLHTGERPHVCPKCDRSFARGDALARHNKGQGGCAGRRSSMGSFGGGDGLDERPKGGEDSMQGLMYTGETSHEPERMDEDVDSADASVRGLPRIRKHDAPPEHHRHSSDQSVYQVRPPSTYPPVATRQSSTGGGLYPPSASLGGAQNSLTQYPPNVNSSSTFQAPLSSVFAQGSMTESPKPLSPGGMSSHQLGHSDSGIHRNRSPSLTKHFQQAQFNLRSNTHNTPPPMGLPPPMPSSSHPNAPHLPSLPGLTPPEPRFTLHSQTTGPTHAHSSGQNSISGPPHTSGGAASPGYHSLPGNISSANNSLSSHSTGPHASGEGSHNIYSQGEDRLWAHVRNLEVQIHRLQEEVLSLKSQLNAGGPR